MTCLLCNTEMNLLRASEGEFECPKCGCAAIAKYDRYKLVAVDWFFDGVIDV